MSEEIKFIGKEGQHYKAIETLRTLYKTQNVVISELVQSLDETVNDWNIMMGRNSNLPSLARPYLDRIRSKDIEAAREFYFYLSPVFYYVQALHETSREAWRIAVTMCGIFSERIVKNIFEEIERHYSVSFTEFLDQEGRFENRIGRLKKELEGRKFQQAEDLHSSLKKIYAVRNRTGPHDVPPPLQARISISSCLPAYMEYLDALIHLGTNLQKDYEGFVSFFSETTRVKSQLVLGQENQTIGVKEFLKEFLYRGGIFSTPRTLATVIKEIEARRYSFSKPSIATALKELSSGRDAVLTRKQVSGGYVYSERYPPSVYFKSEF